MAASNMRKLMERWFIADVENPSVNLSAEKEITTTCERNIILKAVNIKERFLLIGFEGIAPIESKEVETPLLFFLVESKGMEQKILSKSGCRKA